MRQLRPRGQPLQPLQPEPRETWSLVSTRQRAESNPGRHHMASSVLCMPANEHMHLHTPAHTQEEIIAKVLFTHLFLSVMLMLQSARSTIT